MKAQQDFVTEDRRFWAFVRTISEEVHYTERGKDAIKVPTLAEMSAALSNLGLNAASVQENEKATQLGTRLLDYLAHRASALKEVKGQLNTATDAAKMFEEVKARCPHVCNVPMNKQKNEKKALAYFTGAITMLLEERLEVLSPLKTLVIEVDESDARSNWLTRQDLRVLGPKSYVDTLIKGARIKFARRGRQKVYHPGDVQVFRPHCDYDPRTLTTVTVDDQPFRTLSRRIDGAYPSPVNPVAIWEIKEYYYTESFGSRVADGIYETLLDGAELQELQTVGHHVRHYLFVDGYKTWWEDGKPYLCRLVDSLHMKYVDEVLFGREVLTRIPELAAEWVAERQKRALRFQEPMPAAPGEI